MRKYWQNYAKYWSIFKISFQQEFAYKINFILWRVRNVFQIFLVFFLWNTVFSNPGRVVFGYDKEKMLTYIFGIMIVKAVVQSARAMDVAFDVANGDLSNYLLKPVNYFRYWFTRDVSSKALNLAFAAVEFTFLFFILRPPFFFQGNPLIFLEFLVSLAIAVGIYFFLIFLVSAVPFWAPELGWGSHFLVTVVIVESLSGSLFPVDILPVFLQKILMATPFPYLIYFPIQVYLGNISGGAFLQGFFISAAWLLVLALLLKFVWGKGLEVYQSFGR